MNYTEDFEQLWKIYPKRAGGNPKPKAFKAFTARLKEKVLYSDLQAGLLRYYNFCKQTGILNTPYVMQSSTFFSANSEAWCEDWEVPKPEVKETLVEKGKRLNIMAKVGESMSQYEKRIAQAR